MTNPVVFPVILNAPASCSRAAQTQTFAVLGEYVPPLVRKVVRTHEADTSLLKLYIGHRAVLESSLLFFAVATSGM
jgi:hypothetical protein